MIIIRMAMFKLGRRECVIYPLLQTCLDQEVRRNRERLSPCRASAGRVSDVWSTAFRRRIQSELYLLLCINMRSATRSFGGIQTIRREKRETRFENPKHETPMTETLSHGGEPISIILGCVHSCLFRISIFGFRASATLLRGCGSGTGVDEGQGLFDQDFAGHFA